VAYYYRGAGDYNTGGYGSPRGDPGLFSFVGKLLKPIWKVAKPVIGAALGIPMIPTIVGGVAGAVAGKAMVPAGPPPAPPSMPGIGAVVGQAVGAAAGAYISARPAGGVCPSGYHPDKRTGTKCVRNRRMNIANPRALRRSMRRVKGFEKLARRTISFTKRVRIKS